MGRFIAYWIRLARTCSGCCLFTHQHPTSAVKEKLSRHHCWYDLANVTATGHLSQLQGRRANVTLPLAVI